MKLRMLPVIAGFTLISGAAQAFTTTIENDYDSVFPGLCSGFACEQAVAEVRNGNNQTNGTQEFGIGPNTAAPTSIAQAPVNGFWDGTTAHAFDLSYNGSVLSFDVAGLTGALSYTVDLTPTESMYIRAVSRSGLNNVLFTNLQLNGTDVNGGSFSGDDVADYLLISNFDWSSNWSLTGNLNMDGAMSNPGSRPSAQFKLTDLDPNPVPVPGALALMGPVVVAAGLLARRKSRNAGA